MINPYEFLGLTKSECSLSELKTAYYRLALLCHPDKGGDPDAMRTLIKSYQWILEQLTTADEHKKSFDEYYGEALKNGEDIQTTTIPSFTDVLAETFDYTLPRFQSICYLHTITASEIQQMLFIPAFEWAMTKNATPDTLDSYLNTFLENYIRDTQAPIESVEYYVPMSEPSGYGARIATEDSEFAQQKEHYQQPVASNMILYKEPVTLDLPLKASLHNDTSHFGFTNIAAPLPVYDYEEAFTTYHLSGADDLDMDTPLDLENARHKKELERQLQDHHLST